MENLQKKDIIASLVASGVDYFSIAKAFDLKYNEETDKSGAVDIGIIPSDPHVLKRASQLLRDGVSINKLSEVLGISVKELYNLEAANTQIDLIDNVIAKILAENGLSGYDYILRENKY